MAHSNAAAILARNKKGGSLAAALNWKLFAAI
jgi:hypothetical protein